MCSTRTTISLLCVVLLQTVSIPSSATDLSIPVLRLQTTERQTTCNGNVRYESCGTGGACCQLPLRCCSGDKRCCKKDEKCDANKPVKPEDLTRLLILRKSAVKPIAPKIQTTDRQTNTCLGKKKYESCSLSTCCPAPRCCCPNSPSGCCERGGKCFPGSATVTLRSGVTRRMEDLHIGDEVMVAAGVFSPVFAFSHQTPGQRSEYVRLTTASGQVVSATEGHLLLVVRDGKRVPTPADKVLLGDRLPVVVGDRETASDVTDIAIVRDSGLYNPHTLHGEIVVDGVICSTYTRHVPMVAAHSLLTPVRAAFEVLSMFVRPSPLKSGA